jgi:L-arabinose isomerase
MNLNQSAHSDHEFGFLMSRMRLNRKVIVGHWQEAEVQARLVVWTRAACTWHDMQGMKVVRFGDNMRAVVVTERLRGLVQLPGLAGAATDGRWLQLRRLRIVVIEGEVVVPQQALPKLAVWELRPSLKVAAGTWLYTGERTTQGSAER